MNTPSSPPSSSPRLVCRSVRWWSAQHERDTAGPAPGLATRHTAGCPDCANYFAAARTLDATLRHEAQAMASVATQTPVPAGLEDRIWAAVRPEFPAHHQQHRRARFGRGWLRLEVGALAALALAGIVWFSVPPDSGTPAGQTLTNATPEFGERDLQALAANLKNLSERFLAPPAAASNTPPRAGSLESEWLALNSDTRAALRFLERSFLPSATSTTEPDATDPT